MIRVRGLRKVFGSIVAVDGIDLVLRPGETFGLLGPNGAGKSTTIHMMVGALKPDGGEVQLDGELDPTAAMARRRIGVAPQKLSLYDDLTGEENLTFFGKLYGLAGDRLRERIEWALIFAELAERRRDRVKTYSGGMQRRLNLACALIHDPPVLLLDEPTVGVDPQSRNHIFESIEAIRHDGRTILYTTHYMEEAQRLCERVAVMDRGRILAMDRVEDLIARYGGASVVQAELDRPPDDPSKLPGTLTGSSLQFETDVPFEDIGRMVASGVGLTTLRVDKPDLETVFLTLTGRRLRD